MTAISLCLAIHEPYCLRRYTVFDVGETSVYEDDDRSCQRAMYLARTCYLPLHEVLHNQIERSEGKFRVAFSISDAALDLFEQYTPEVLDGLISLAKTGCVEFIGETGPHSLAFLYSKDEFVHLVEAHAKRLKKLFGQKPVSFRNPELLYNNDVAETIQELGFRAILTEGSPSVLGWRNANYVYTSSVAPKVRLLLRNPKLSATISQDFGSRGMMAEDFANLCAMEKADIVNIFLDSHAFGLRNKKDTGIFDFLSALPNAVLQNKNLSFQTPSQVIELFEPKDSLAIPNSISWSDEGSDLRGWLGNEMQKDALTNCFKLTARVHALNNEDMTKDFERLQTSDYFHYMSTSWFSESQPDRPNPFASPYDAYISYMNILADFSRRLKIAEEENKKNAPKEMTADGTEQKKRVVTKRFSQSIIRRKTT
ncbi:MAG: glycoside hydrolase family 57 protein [Desulfovibrionaceae bacterium]|nr:glycoside hydrolase family 57 protein [Desulfovibrionaceae bacterium]